MTDATNPFRPVAAPSDLPTAPEPATVPPIEPATVPAEGVRPAETQVDAVVGAVAGPVGAADDPADAVARETDLLEQLEADLAAVETAIATIERISTDGVGGEQAAVEIGAAVSVDRFGSTMPTASEQADAVQPAAVQPAADPSTAPTD